MIGNHLWHCQYHSLSLTLKNIRANHSAICLCSFEYVQNMHFFETTWKSWQRVQILDIFCTGRNHTISNIFEDLSVDLARSEFHFNSFTLKMFEWEENHLGYDLHAWLPFATDCTFYVSYIRTKRISSDGESPRLESKHYTPLQLYFF